MNTLRARRRTRGGSEDGVTLVELCVAMVISGIVAVAVATTTIQAFRVQRDTTLRENDSTAASLAMEVLTRDFRQALAPQAADGSTTPAFGTATPTSATLVTWVGVDPVQVSYLLVGGTLTRTVRQPTTAGRGAHSAFGAAGRTTVSTLTRNVASTALFSYVRSGAVGPVGTVTGTDLALVRGVAVDLTVDSDGAGRLPGTNLRNTVTCLNL